MGDMSELTRSTCRLCLKSFQDLDIIDDCEKDTIQIVLPQIDLDHIDNLVICTECIKMLQQSFAFKSKCLEIEDSIHDFKNNEKSQVNLEEVLGIRKDHNSKWIKICRTCLGYLENNVFTELDKANDLVIKMCLPEMDIELTSNPVICEFCEKLLKKIYDFITQCIQNDEKIKSYFKQNDSLSVNHVVPYVLHKDNSPRLECSEVDVKDDSSAVKNDYIVPKVQNMDSATNINEQDEIYVISDAEEEIVDTETIKKSDKSRAVQGKSRKRSTSAEVVIIDDSMDSLSDEEWFSRYYWKKRQKKKRKTVERSLKGKIYCKYCHHATLNELSLKKHISFCPKNPCLTGKILLVTNIASTIDTSKDLENSKQNVTKYKVKVVNTTKNVEMTARKRALDKEGKIIDEPNSKKILTSNCSSLNEIEIVYNSEFPFTEKVSPTISKTTSITTYLHVKGTKINYSMLKTELIGDEEKQKNIKLAIENNKKKTFSELEVLVCNHCTFNSRSNLKMALHCPSHLSSGKKKVNYADGYKSVFYCVNCTKTFRTKSYLHSHVDSCTRLPDDEKFLFRVGKVMHCTKCYFDSDDMQLVLQHLLKCGDINMNQCNL